MPEALHIPMDIDDLPGAQLIRTGFADLQSGKHSAEGLLLASATSRLRHLGIPIPESARDIEDPEHALYSALNERFSGPGEDTYYRYNAWRRELDSFIAGLTSIRRSSA